MSVRPHRTLRTDETMTLPDLSEEERQGTFPQRTDGFGCCFGDGGLDGERARQGLCRQRVQCSSALAGHAHLEWDEGNSPVFIGYSYICEGMRGNTAIQKMKEHFKNKHVPEQRWAN